MGERAKVILNEFSAKSMLMRDTVDLNKFYTADLKLMIEVAKKEIKKLQEENILLKASEPMSKLAEDYGYKSEVEKLTNIIQATKNNVLKDISMIKIYKDMSKEEIINRLESTLIILGDK